MSSHVAVAIVAFRNPGDIKACLAALARSIHTDFSVYICENGGEAAYQTLAASVPAALPGGQRVLVLNSGDNLGYAGGVNHCLAAAGDSYDAAWVLNPDTEPEPGAMAALLRRLNVGDVDAVGGVIATGSGQVQSYGGRWRPWLAMGGAIGLFSQLDAPVDAKAIEAQQAYLSGASMLVSRRFVEVAGPMQADFFLYAEEIEWCLRGRSKGFRLGFAPDAIVRHHEGSTTGWSGPFHLRPKMPIYLDARNRVRVTRQMEPWRLPVAAPAILLHSLWRYARRGAWRQVGYVFEGVFAGLRGESGRPSWVK